MIRKARKGESLQIAQLMLLAMEDIVYAFLGNHSPNDALEFMDLLVRQEGNQYSFENTWVAEENKQLVGSITVYEGAKLQQLRQPVVSLLAEKYKREVAPEDETEPGEFYIDTIAVHRNHQGKGLGTQLLKFVISQIVHQDGNVLALLVDVNNSKAKNLYLQLGFQPVGKKQLMGHPYEHLQVRRRAKR
jgi:ribosomal protein S18 acetylase RimI-like enzyme